MTEFKERRPQTVPISIRFEAKILQHLREQARKLSCEWNRDVSYADLIRIAVARQYPAEDGVQAAQAIPAAQAGQPAGRDAEARAQPIKEQGAEDDAFLNNPAGGSLSKANVDPNDPF